MPKLKAVIDESEFEELTDVLKDLYTKRESDDKYELDADIEEHSATRGMKSAMEKQKQESKKARESLAQFLKGLGTDNPEEAAKAIEEYKKLAEDQKKIKDKKLLEEGQIEKILDQRMSEARKEWETKLKELSEENTKLKTQNSNLLIDTAVQNASGKVGIRPSAMTDVVLRAKQIFRVEDGKAVPYNGEEVMFGKNGHDPMTPEEWLEKMREAAPHWYEPSSGGGAPGDQNTRRARGQFVLSREEARDPKKYQAVRDQAQKAGQEVEILPE